MIKSIKLYFSLFGFELSKTVYTLSQIPYFISTYFKLKSQLKGDFKFGKIYPILFDKRDSGGVASGHYFQQDIFVAKKILQNNPIRHIDIGSRVNGFVAHVSIFREIEIFDIREIISKTQNIIFRQADLMSLPDGYLECTDSISSLHAIEHFGLGRYGDPIDAYGHIKAIENISRMLKKGGVFYFSTPIGKQRIEFNAHRVFSVKYLLEILNKSFELKSFSYIDDNDVFFEDIIINDSVMENELNCNFGCGIFVLTRK